jgi:nucleoside-diphosphate-sugar epimerase
MSLAPADTLVVVTGITGFTGSHIAVKLLSDGYQVRGTLRSRSRVDAIKQVLANHAPIERLSFAEAELDSDSGWDEAMTNATYLIHVASPIAAALPDNPDAMVQTAVGGTIRVLSAAQRQGVTRTVLTSSSAATSYGHKGPSRTFTEQDWTDPEGPGTTPYIKSKTLAERAAWEFVRRPNINMELVSINPSAILGPVLEKDYGTSAEIVLKLLRGDLPATPNLGFAVVDVRDVADLHVLGMTIPEAAGQRFNAANGFLWWPEIAQVLIRERPELSRKVPRFKLPSLLVRLLSRFDPAVKSVLQDLDQERRADASNAMKILGWQPRSAEEAVLSTADSLKTLGLV